MVSVLKVKPSGTFFAPAIPYITIGLGLLVFQNAWIALLSYHAVMILTAVLLKPRVPVKRCVSCNSIRLPLIMSFLGVVGGALLYLLWPLLSVPPDVQSYLRSIGLTLQSWPFFITYFALVNPWVEEYYWRGYLGSAERRLVWNDLWFSGYHIIVLAGRMEIIWLIVVFLVLAAGAWLWRQANRMNGGLLPSILCHLTADISTILVIYWMLK